MKPLSQTLEARDRIARSFKMLAQEFAGRPGDISIRAEATGDSFALTVVPHQEDVGKFVGTDGVMDKAMRVVISVLAKREGFATATYVVKDGDAPPSRREHNHKPEEKNWPTERISNLFDQTCRLLFVKPYSWRWNHKDWKSTIMISIAADEARHVTDIELGEALSRIFGAIGRCHGRKVFVNLERRGA